MYATAVDHYDLNGAASHFLASCTTTPSNELTRGLAGAMTALLENALRGDRLPLEQFTAGLSNLVDVEDLFGAARHSVLDSYLDGDIGTVNRVIGEMAQIEAAIVAPRIRPHLSALPDVPRRISKTARAAV